MEANGREGEAATTRTVVDTDSLTMRGEQREGAVIATVAGRIDGGNALEFQSALEALAGEQAASVIVDLADLSYISSAGLRAMLVVAKQVQGKGAKMGVCSLSDSINEIFQISGFDKFIPVHAAQADALSALSE